MVGIVIILFCWHYPVSVVRTSRACIQEWKKLCALKNRKQSIGSCKINSLNNCKILEKYGRSLGIVRINLFQSCYYDRMTPFALFNFSIRLAIKMTIGAK